MIIMVVKEFTSDDWVIKIDHDKCVGAGECVEVCPSDVFEIIENKSNANHVDECIECCACVGACPVEAIDHSSC